MPTRPPNNCEFRGCAALANGRRYCSSHIKVRPSIVESKKRVNPWSAMYGRKWRRARSFFLKKNSLCVHCLDENKVTQATDVDHVKAHKGDASLFWDSSNWQALCKSHHSKKTVNEDGGFGRG